MSVRDAARLLTILAAGAAMAGDPPVDPESRGKPEDEVARIQAQGRASLHDCYRLALAASERMGIAGERLAQARARRAAARALLMPQVSIVGTEFRQTSVMLEGTGGSFVPTEDSRRELRARLEQAVTRFGAERAGLREVARRESSAAWSYADAARQLYGALARAYMDVLFRQREVFVREEAVETGRERLREMEARQEVGLARRAELLSIRTQLSSDEAALEDARAAIAVARGDLAVLIGLPVDVPLEDVALPVVAETEPGEGELLESIEKRPDVVAARLMADAEASHVRFVRGDFLPRLSLSANYYLKREGYSEFQEATDWDATLTLAVPVFSGGSGRARLAEATSVEREARLSLEALRKSARRDAQAALVTLRSARARLRTLQDGLSFAEESAALASEEYRQGISTNLEVETARIARSRARLDLERQRLDLLLAHIDLQLALGRIPEASTPTPGETR